MFLDRTMSVFDQPVHEPTHGESLVGFFDLHGFKEEANADRLHERVAVLNPAPPALETSGEHEQCLRLDVSSDLLICVWKGAEQCSLIFESAPHCSSI